MSIVTKNGDKGMTSLCRGSQAFKDSLRIEAGGALDEASSFLGLAKCLVKDKALKKIIEQVQKDLLILGTEVVTLPKYLNQLKSRLDAQAVTFLEENINKLEKSLKLKKSFCLYGQNLSSASLDIARASTRRAERRTVSLARKSGLKNKYLLIYLNRLSDLLYLLARQAKK